MTLSKRRLLAAGAALAALLVVSSGTASQPPDGSVTVPSANGQTGTYSWTGTILPGANPTSNCASQAQELSDVHTVTIDVPAGVYDTLTADFTFKITWESPVVSGPGVSPHAVHDEILTVVGPD